MSSVKSNDLFARNRGRLMDLQELSQPLVSLLQNPTLTPAAKQAHDDVMIYLDRIRDESEISSLLAAASETPLREQLTEANALFHTLCEVDLAQRFILSNSSDAFADSWINKGFPDLLRGQVKQWESCGLEPKREGFLVAVVGSGALPQTQVFLFKNLGCSVIAIERDPTSAGLCREVLDKLGHRQLGVVNCDGNQFDFAGVDVVVVATLVTGKEYIGQQVARTSIASVFCPRVPVRLHSMWRESFTRVDIVATDWTLVNRFEPEDSSVASLMFVRRSTR